MWLSYLCSVPYAQPLQCLSGISMCLDSFSTLSLPGSPTCPLLPNYCPFSSL